MKTRKDERTVDFQRKRDASGGRTRLIYGTGNLAKLSAMRRRLAPLPLEILSLNDIRGELSEEAWERIQDIEEDGKTLLENARKKAKAYYREIGEPVFSCDSGLYFDNVPEELQPGVHVRTINGRRYTDEEMEEYYTGLAKRYGDLRARYRNAVCLVTGPGKEYSLMDDSIASEYFLITSVPHERPCRPGFPLDRISLDIRTGKYYYDLEQKDLDQVAVEDGYLTFFQKIFGGDA